MTEWRPIDTAPQNNVPFIGAYKVEDRKGVEPYWVINIIWDNPSTPYISNEGYGKFGVNIYRGWLCLVGDDVPIDYKVTHWMPLPEPPK